MYKNWLFSLVLIVFFLVTSFVEAESITKVEVDLIGDIVSISAPDNIFLGNVSKGFRTNDSIQIIITNTGTTSISVTPELVNSDEIFSNLYFKRIQSDSFKRIGEFSMNISRPSELGGTRQQSMYVKLDLSDYTGSLDSGVTRRYANVRFITTAV